MLQVLLVTSGMDEKIPPQTRKSLFGARLIRFSGCTGAITDDAERLGGLTTVATT